jgi:hypothetical protein
MSQLNYKLQAQNISTASLKSSEYVIKSYYKDKDFEKV